MPTAEHIWADVGRAPSLVLQQVIFAHQVLPKAEIRYGYSMSPGENQKASVNKKHHAMSHTAQTEEADTKTETSMGKR